MGRPELYEDSEERHWKGDVSVAIRHVRDLLQAEGLARGGRRPGGPNSTCRSRGRQHPRGLRNGADDQAKRWHSSRRMDRLDLAAVRLNLGCR